MPVRVDNVSVDFEPYTETINVVTRKCYRCTQVKDIDCTRINLKKKYFWGKGLKEIRSVCFSTENGLHELEHIQNTSQIHC